MRVHKLEQKRTIHTFSGVNMPLGFWTRRIFIREITEQYALAGRWKDRSELITRVSLIP